MSLKFPQKNIYKHTVSLVLSNIFIIVQILTGSFSAYSQSHHLPEGVALSIDVEGGDKGLILPKVELTDLTVYEPIKGKAIEGLIVENTRLDESKGITRGLYIWDGDKWNKLLNYSDIPPLAKGTKVYTGSDDPNQSSLPEVRNSPIGSLYINTTNNIILKKVANTAESPVNWVNELSLETGKHVGSTSIKIKTDSTGLRDSLEVIAASGMQITGEGLSIAIDSTNMSVNQNGIIAKSSEPLWNANQLQGMPLGIQVPKEGDILRYDGSKWLNISQHVYISGNAINITNDTIRALIDTTTLKIVNNQVGARNTEPLWNANKLYNTEIDITNPSKGEIVKYDGNKLLNQSERVYKSGQAIDVTDNKISALIDTAMLRILPDNKISAKNEESLWNAGYLLGTALKLSEPKADQLVKYDSNPNQWTNAYQQGYTGGAGIEVNNKDFLIQLLLDTATLKVGSPEIEVQAKNEEALWNAGKLQGLDIQAVGSPSDMQILRYDGKNTDWAFKNMNLPPTGIDKGEILIWDYDHWQPQYSQKFLVAMRSKTLYLTGFSIKENVITHIPTGGKLLLGSKLPERPNTTYMRKWDGEPWSIYGNKDMPEGDYILGFTKQSDPSGVNKNIILKTQGTERMRISGDGKIDFKSNNIHFQGLGTPQEQSPDKEYIMMVDKNKRLKLWSGKAFSNTGENSTENADYILGFNKEKNTDDQSVINFITKNINRMQITDSEDDRQFIIASPDIYFLDLPGADIQGELSILMLDKDDKLVKSNYKLPSKSLQSLFVHNKELQSNTNTPGFTDSSSNYDIVFKAQNKDILRIENTGEIKMQLSNAKENTHDDIVVIDRNNGTLLKANLGSILADAKNLYTNDKTNSNNTIESKTKVIPIADTGTTITDINIDAAGLDGAATVQIVYADSEPETATTRYGTALLKIGYDNTGNLPGILTYAYDMTNNNKSILKTNLETYSIAVGGINISFNLKKIGNTYKITPNINKGDKNTGYLILQTKTARTLTTSTELK